MDTNSYPPKTVERDVSYGVGNGDDLIYLFPILSGTFRFDEIIDNRSIYLPILMNFRPLPHDDLVFSQRFIQLLTSFARDAK